MIIDIHAHAVRKVGYHGKGLTSIATIEQLEKYYSQEGIDKVCLLPLCGPEFHLPQSNEEILDFAANNQRFVPFCNIHPYAISNSVDADLTDVMLYYKDQGCRGIGEATCLLPFDNPFVYNFFKCAAKAKLPVTIHIAHRKDRAYGLYDDPGLPKLEDTLKRFEDLIIVGHSQSFWAEMSILETVNDRSGYPPYKIKDEGAVPKIMRKYGNLYGDLSAFSGYNALNRDHEYAAVFLNEFQDRLMFGLDICGDPEKAFVSDLKNLLCKFKEDGIISPEIFDKVTYLNARKLYNI